MSSPFTMSSLTWIRIISAPSSLASRAATSSATSEVGEPCAPTTILPVGGQNGFRTIR